MNGRAGAGLSFQSAVLHQLQKRGLAMSPAAASVWVHGETPEQFESARDIIFGLMGDQPQLQLVLTSNDRWTVDFLRTRFPDEHAATLPGSRFLDRFIARVRPGLLVLIGGEFDPHDLAMVHRHGVRTASLVPSAPPAASRDGHVQVRVSGPDVAPHEILLMLRPLRPAAPNLAIGDAWIRGTLRDRIGQSRLWRRASRWWTTKRIDSFERLREYLGSPRKILCVGNGPSSEDPRLAEIRYDCLMRVNWRWRDRGFLNHPDIVFVGDAKSLHKVSPRVFGFWNGSIELAGLLRHLATRGPRRMAYFTVERLSPLVSAREWRARPSNGALMVVIAAALAPEQLAIGGMDLFQHPEGRYPGDPYSRNEYSRCHNREVDIELMDLALRDYKGELVILCENLRRALEQVREANGARTP